MPVANETVTNALGYAVEVQQAFQEGYQSLVGTPGYQSAFSPEDIPSNAAGASFGAIVESNPDLSLSEAFGAWGAERNVGFVGLQSPESTFGSLPSKDPSDPKSGIDRGSNFSSGNPADRSTVARDRSDVRNSSW